MQKVPLGTNAEVEWDKSEAHYQGWEHSQNWQSEASWFALALPKDGSWVEVLNRTSGMLCRASGQAACENMSLFKWTK